MNDNEIAPPVEQNPLKKDILLSYRSNSQFHYKNISDYNFEHRIKLDPFSKNTSLEIRNHIPANHIYDSYVKHNHSTLDLKNAFEKSDHENIITHHLRNQSYQNLLRKEKKINKICKKKKEELKKNIHIEKMKLKNDLTRIIKDAIRFSKKNNQVRAMLPNSINEIVDKFRQEAQNMSMSLNISHISKISKVDSLGLKSSFVKNDFLNLLGIDLENLNENHVDIDIDKCWNFVDKFAKGKKISDILRYKVVNEIMTITEKKSAEKAKKIYEKLDIYRKYMAGKKAMECEKKKVEEEKIENTIRKNTKEFIKQKMMKSLSESKFFSTPEDTTSKGRRKRYEQNPMPPEKENEEKNNIIRLNALNDAKLIMDFIDKSKKNSQSKLCKKHFENIIMTKMMNTSLKNMLRINEIKIN